MSIKSLFQKRTEGKQQEEQAPSPATAKKKKRRRKWIILGVILVVIAALLVNCSLQAQKMASMFSLSNTVVLTRSDIESTVGATGTVESADSHTVYSTQNYPVKAVHVEVGDVVQEGDLLCELDASALEDQIEAQELSTGISAEAAAQQVKTARDNYNAAREALDEGLNTSIVSADNNVRATYDAWQKAIRTYENYEESLDDDTNATLIQYDNAVDTAYNTYTAAKSAYTAAESALQAAQAALAAYPATGGDTSAAEAALSAAQADEAAKEATRNNALAAYQAAEAAYNATPSAENQSALAAAKAFYEDAQQAYEDAQDAVDAAEEALRIASGNINSAEYVSLQANVAAKQAALNTAATTRDNAKNAYDTAKAQRSAAYDNADTTLSDYARAVDTARDNYNAALVSLEAAQQSAKTQLQSSKNALSSAEINGNTDSAVLKLAQMQEDLEETRMTANATGTVTAVYAKVGANGAGLMFVIEDVGNLIVKTSVSGYDIGNVTVGMPVTIKSDATGETVISGKISTIAPTSEKNAQGQTNTTGDVLFDTEVSVLDKNTGLRIGMSARLKYIVEQQSGVIAVPFDALYEKEDGQSYVLAAIPQTDGKYLLKEIAVTQGLENDLDVVITGNGVEEGLRIPTPGTSAH
ncbi:MAG: HlyD family efflux transporter periplasmic adaptor subunit [Bacillota bacterium]